jgi:hypothetical protein
MRIKMKVQISGTRNGEAWPAPGTEIDMPDDEALVLLAAGNAKAVSAAPDAPETANLETADAPDAPETADMPKVRKR